MELQQRPVDRLEQQLRTEGHALAAEQHMLGAGMAGRVELARFVELGVVRQVALRHDAEHAPLMQHRRAVVEQLLDAQRQPDDGDHRQPARGRRHPVPVRGR